MRCTRSISRPWLALGIVTAGFLFMVAAFLSAAVFALVYGVTVKGWIGFDDIPAALDDLRHHRLTGRIVARY